MRGCQTLNNEVGAGHSKIYFIPGCSVLFVAASPLLNHVMTTRFDLMSEKINVKDLKFFLQFSIYFINIFGDFLKHHILCVLQCYPLGVFNSVKCSLFIFFRIVLFDFLLVFFDDRFSADFFCSF